MSSASVGPSAALDGWTMRPYQPGDETQLVALFGQVFGRPLSLTAWRWKFRAQPLPVENIWVACAESDGRIVAQYAGIPVRVQLAGAAHPAMISVDTMTAPDFRRRGILTALGPAIFASWAAAGITAVLGLPNDQWASRTGALGWVEQFPLAWLRAPLHAERALARKLPGVLGVPAAAVAGVGVSAWHRMGGPAGSRPPGLSVNAVDAADGEFDALWRRLAAEYENLVVRDSGWVNWRYLQAPEFSYRVLLASADGAPVGYIAYRRHEQDGRMTGVVADLFTAPTDTATARALVGAALDDLWAQGAETARATAPPGGPLDGLLRAAGFRAAPGAFDFRVVPLAADFDAAALADVQRWHLSGGDFDVV